jgi:RNA polymerase sigma factor (sigma-70 family)
VRVSQTQAFRDLLAKVRGGDQAAAAELVRQYETELRRAVRVRLTDPRLRRVLDSADVCQSVLAQFFVRVAAGEFDLDRPEQLLHLLVRMARNKVLDKARRQQADKRDQRRVDLAPAARLDELSGNAPGPERIVANQDLLSAVRRLLSEDERHLADQRAQGREWRDLSHELGAQPDALRKKLSRGLDRVLAQLGLEGINDD